MKAKMFFRTAAVVLGLFAIVLVGKGVLWYNWSHLTVNEKAALVTDKMASRLELTAIQREQVMALNLEKLKSFENSKGCQELSNRRDHDSPIKNWKNDLKKILTEEQQKKMKL